MVLLVVREELLPVSHPCVPFTWTCKLIRAPS